MKTSNPLANLMAIPRQPSSNSSLLGNSKKTSLTEQILGSTQQISEPFVIENKKPDRAEKQLDPKYRLTPENIQKLFDKVDELQMQIDNLSAKYSSLEKARNSDLETGNSREAFWKGIAFGTLVAFSLAFFLLIKFS